MDLLPGNLINIYTIPCHPSILTISVGAQQGHPSAMMHASMSFHGHFFCSCSKSKVKLGFRFCAWWWASGTCLKLWWKPLRLYEICCHSVPSHEPTQAKGKINQLPQVWHLHSITDGIDGTLVTLSTSLEQLLQSMAMMQLWCFVSSECFDLGSNIHSALWEIIWF